MTSGTISLTALDVGFDLKVHGVPVVLPPDVTAVRYEVGGRTATVRGPRQRIVAALRRAGYRIAPSPGAGEVNR